MKLLNYLLFAGLKGVDVALIVVGAVIVVAILIKIIVSVVKKKTKKQTEEEIALKNQTQTDVGRIQEQIEAGNAIVLSKNVIYAVGVNGNIKAGAYLISCSVSSVEKFNVRYNGLVSEFQADSQIVLAEGDTICGVSHSLVLKATK